MKQRPILFNGAMVRAVLSGEKTQTRRAVKSVALDWIEKYKFTPEFVADPANKLCKFGSAGDQLWVRETFMDLRGTGVEHRPDPRSPLQRYAYQADTPPGTYGDEARKEYGLKWTPSIHMRRAASRITLEITGIRVERLQDIREEDALAEGASGGHGAIPGYQYSATPLEHFKHIWQSTGGDWEANPWAWVIKFKRVEQ